MRLKARKTAVLTERSASGSNANVPQPHNGSKAKQHPSPEKGAEFLSKPLADCSESRVIDPEERLQRVVRLPCSRCDNILPSFTVSFALSLGGVATKVIACPNCEALEA